MRLLVTRPEPDALKLRAALEELGHEATVEPLLQVSFENCDAVDFEGVQAVIATSRNALRALRSHPARGVARALPLFAVGKATAEAARALGFGTVVTGAGTVHELVTHIVSVADPANGLLLHLAGDRLAGDLKGELEQQGFRVLQPVVYRTAAISSFSDGHVGAAGLGRDRRCHTAIAAHCDNIRRTDGQAWPDLDCAGARSFLPVGGRGQAPGPAGSASMRGRGGSEAGRNTCSD